MLCGCCWGGWALWVLQSVGQHTWAWGCGADPTNVREYCCVQELRDGGR